jgi:hypothetical protein
MGKIPMKRRLLILISFFVLSSSIGFAQKVSLNYSRTNLRTVLERVTEQTDYTLAFSKEVVNLSDEVTIYDGNFGGDALADILAANDLAFVNENGKWTLEEGDFMLQAGDQTADIQCTETKIWETPNR